MPNIDLVSSAMKKFQSFDRNARLENDTVLDTVHQNTITCLCIYKGMKGSASKVSTSGNDGQLVIWDIQVSIKLLQIPLSKFVGET